MNRRGKQRTGLPVLAIFVALVTSLLVLSWGSAYAQTTTSSSTSTSTTSTTSSTSSTSTSSTTSTTVHSTTTTTTPAQGCHGDFDGGTVSPGATVKGTLTLSNGCKFTGTVDVSLNGKTLQKTPDASGAVAVSVKINSMTSGVLDDPVDVPLHQGVNTVVVSGQGQTQSGASAGTVTIDATFNLQPASTPTTQATTATVTPVTTQTTTTSTGGNGLPHTGLNLLALVAVAFVAIALGAHAMATQWAVAGDTYTSVFDKGDRPTLEHVMLTAAAYILGPPPGRHSRYAGPRGLLPMLREWADRIS